MKMPSGAATLIAYFVLWAFLIALNQHLTGKIAPTLIPGILGMLAVIVAGRIREKFKNFKPHSKLDARIANEKIKLTAQALNASAVAIVSLWVVSRLLAESGDIFSDPMTSIYIAIAIWWHWVARQSLNFLVDEDGHFQAPVSPPPVSAS